MAKKRNRRPRSPHQSAAGAAGAGRGSPGVSPIGVPSTSGSGRRATGASGSGGTPRATSTPVQRRRSGRPATTAASGTGSGSARRRQKKPQKYQAKALKEIRHYQKSTELLIRKAPFSRVIREIMSQRSASVSRLTPGAFEALRHAAEAVIVMHFEESYLLTLHAKRVTLMVSDMQLMNRIKPISTNFINGQ